MSVVPVHLEMTNSAIKHVTEVWQFIFVLPTLERTPPIQFHPKDLQERKELLNYYIIKKTHTQHNYFSVCNPPMRKESWLRKKGTALHRNK